VLAVVIVLVGFASAAVKANIPRIHPSGLTPTQFTIVGVTSLGLFAVFTAIGGVVLVASWPLRLMIGRTEWWTHIGEAIAKVGAGM
jgi:hypothetical protein